MYGRAQSFFRFFLQLHKSLISIRWSLHYELSQFRSSIVHHLSYIFTIRVQFWLVHNPSDWPHSSIWFCVMVYNTESITLSSNTMCLHFALFVVANIVVCISGHKWRLSIPSPYLHPNRLVYVNIHVKEWDDKTRHSDGTNAFEHHKVIKLAKCGKMRALGHRIKNLKMKQNEVSTTMYHPHRDQKAGN